MTVRVLRNYSVGEFPPIVYDAGKEYSDLTEASEQHLLVRRVAIRKLDDGSFVDVQGNAVDINGQPIAKGVVATPDDEEEDINKMSRKQLDLLATSLGIDVSGARNIGEVRGLIEAYRAKQADVVTIGDGVTVPRADILADARITAGVDEAGWEALPEPKRAELFVQAVDARKAKFAASSAT
jgi:hypothetical protein